MLVAEVVAAVGQPGDAAVRPHRAGRRLVRISEVRRVVAVHAGDLPDLPHGARRPRDRDPLGDVFFEEQHLAELGDGVVLILVVVRIAGRLAGLSGSSALIFFHSSSVKSSVVPQAATSELIIAAAQTIILKRMFFLLSSKRGRSIRKPAPSSWSRRRCRTR